ncbi:hypothetical protein QYZ88_014430 [Lachnospiraceae bacterium C1.1]|nr:hypothetical protein [Lachnospiraceae bacterium C1.1]
MRNEKKFMALMLSAVLAFSSISAVSGEELANEAASYETAEATEAASEAKLIKLNLR